MKTYLINLERAPERFARMEGILAVQSINFERVAAVDGRQFSDAELKRYRENSPRGKELSAGDIACGLSHLAVLKKIAEGKDEYAVVLEDDLHLASDVGFFLNSTKWIPDKADIIKLETFQQITTVERKAGRLDNDRQISRLISLHGGAAIYVIRREAAARIVNSYRPGVELIDYHMFGSLIDQCNIYQVWPAPAVQDTVGGFHSTSYLASDINGQPFPTGNEPQGFAKIRREIFRLVAKIKSAISSLVVRVTTGNRRGRIEYRP